MVFITAKKYQDNLVGLMAQHNIKTVTAEIASDWRWQGMNTGRFALSSLGRVALGPIATWDLFMPLKSIKCCPTI